MTLRPRDPEADGEAFPESAEDLGHAAEAAAMPLPELSPPRRVDRWAHRRVEPRGLALFWTLYLLGVTVVCFWTPATSAGLDALAGRYSSRLVLTAVTFGFTVLWPMLRLCQVFPGEGGMRSVMKDLVVIVVPTQAVVWPLTFLAVWPPMVAASLAASTLAWTLVTGALLAMALGRGGGPRGSALRRVVWMIVIVAATARPVGLYDATFVDVTGFTGAGGMSDVGRLIWGMTSAVSTPLTLTIPPQGRLEWVTPLQWGMIGVTFLLALGLWLMVAAMAGPRTSEPSGMMDGRAL